ncbi:DUF4374 domain-containing protein [uncultured Prevotella sp.]|uniref:DUF4374 domain-containing protein n=1 Tax=uncultured Prevotella sp. TaxID=159272 RepID=UPI0025885E18|nr:DUF4374 domain-containing protein [uncultured Prevotella sp.]
MKTLMSKRLYSGAAVMLALSLPLFTACSSDDTAESTNGESGGIATGAATSGHFFLDAASDDGTEYILQNTSVSDGDLNIKSNIKELPTSPYTWVFKDSYAVGMSYQQQYAGLGYCVKLTDENKPFEQIGQFQVNDRFTTYGFVDDLFVTSVSGQTRGDRTDIAVFDFWTLDDSGVKLFRSKSRYTADIAGDDQQATFSGIVDNGDGTFLTAMIKSDHKDDGSNAQGGSIGNVKYPDSCWVVKMDTALNIKAVYGDNRISYACGQFRSQTLNSIYKVDDGTVYVFSNSYESTTTLPAGALRIKKGADGFDKDYYFNIQSELGGYKFRRVWPITGSKFLLELYDDKTPTSTGAARHYAVIDMETKSHVDVTGLPDKLNITSGQTTGDVPMVYDGKIYIPITQRGGYAALYNVDPDTGVATKGITVTGAASIRSVGYLK